MGKPRATPAYRRRMPHSSFLRNHGKTSRTPRRPFEKQRLDIEMKLIGEFGLKNKREVWRTQLTLARIRKAARVLLTLDEKDPKRLFEGGALLRRLMRLGVLDETKQQLDYVLALKPADFMERRLQTQVFKLGLAKSIHHARVLIRQRHIRCVLLALLLSWHISVLFPSWLSCCPHTCDCCISELANRLSTSPLSWCEPTARSTSTFLLRRHTVAVDLAATRGRRSLPRAAAAAAAMTTRTWSKQ